MTCPACGASHGPLTLSEAFVNLVGPDEWDVIGVIVCPSTGEEIELTATATRDDLEALTGAA